VDGFERRMGMDSGGRGKGLHKKTTRNVELHGDLGRVRCTLCFTDYAADKGWVEMMREGEAPECPKCLERCESPLLIHSCRCTGTLPLSTAYTFKKLTVTGSSRIKRSARATPIGSLRPSIVLYDEPHPLGDDIGMLQAHDMSKTPDVMIIMGTSLKVSGLKALVKDFAKAIHGAKRPGMVVFVNATKPGKEWEGVIDVHVQGETDAWVDKVEEAWKRVKPADWEVQTKLDMPVVAPASVGVQEKGKGQSMFLDNTRCLCDSKRYGSDAEVQATSYLASKFPLRDLHDPPQKAARARLPFHPSPRPYPRLCHPARGATCPRRTLLPVRKRRVLLRPAPASLLPPAEATCLPSGQALHLSMPTLTYPRAKSLCSWPRSLW
jgi:NAD-dependent SIR2 family protein deacetylase